MFNTKSTSRMFSVLFIVLMLIGSIAIPIPAGAAGILYVTPVGTGDCSSWENACTLQAALTGAISGNEIWVSAGTYKPTAGADRTATFQLKPGVTLYGGFAGTETARDQRNLASNVTVLSGDLNGDDVGFADNAENVYHVVTGASGATLNGFTITAGNANNGSNCPDACGGGMYNNVSNPTLTNITLNGNSASYQGSGMYNWSSSPILTNVTVSGNANSYEGGGIYFYSGSPTLTNVTISGNLASYGGGIYNNSGNLSLINVMVNDNSASANGGGIINYFGGASTLTNVTISGNSTNGAGGGMSTAWSNPTLTNVTVRGNSASMSGGGMYNSNGGPQIRNSIFWGNTATDNSKQIYSNSSEPLVVSDSVVEGGCPATVVTSICTHIITIDPKLGTIANYGGFTQTIPLLAGSSAINSGNDTTCAAADQRGVARPQGVHCDIGAYEYTGIYYVKPIESGTGNCQSWNNPCALQTALSGAISGDEIWAAAGTYTPTTGTDRTATFQLKAGVAIYGGFAGTEITRDQRNPASNVTILSGDLNGDDAGFTNNIENVYHVVTGASGATLDGFTITAGNANGTDPNNSGGGMDNDLSDPTLTNVIFDLNTAVGSGGGLDNDFSNPTLTNVTFSRNSANLGGGMNNRSSSPMLMNVTFSGNSASYGGGMYNNSGNPTMTNATFSGNLAGWNGGGMENDSYSYPTIRDTIFWGNTAATDGAAQVHNDSSIPVMNDSIVQGGCPVGSTCTNIIITDPKLGALGNYGGFTHTIPILVGSSAIDAGNDLTCAAADQRGITRPQGPHCDIGAYEFKPGIFADVDPTYWANSYIERLYNAGLTGGCSLTPKNYCPDASVTRAQMAVFLLKGVHGSNYTSPAVGTTTGFTDVPVGYWAAAWIKQLAAEGITGGCGTGMYCPDAPVTRAQMAVFLLKAEHGSAYAPPPATGVFTDVTVDYWARNWIEQLASEGITSGCGAGTYCPDAGVTRAQMAVFLVKTFSLP